MQTAVQGRNKQEGFWEGDWPDSSNLKCCRKNRDSERKPLGQLSDKEVSRVMCHKISTQLDYSMCVWEFVRAPGLDCPGLWWVGALTTVPHLAGYPSPTPHAVCVCVCVCACVCACVAHAVRILMCLQNLLGLPFGDKKVISCSIDHFICPNFRANIWFRIRAK